MPWEWIIIGAGFLVGMLLAVAGIGIWIMAKDDQTFLSEKGK